MGGHCRPRTRGAAGRQAASCAVTRVGERDPLRAARRAGIAWTIFDARIAGIARPFEDFRQAETAGAVLVADTIEGLAAAAHLPPDALAGTLAEVEAHKAAGSTDAFGRSFASSWPLAAPYRVACVTGALFHTQGGLVVDADARVLRPDGSRLANLFATGGAACGVSGPDPSGYLSGNGLLTAVAYDRLAGLAAGFALRR